MQFEPSQCKASSPDRAPRRWRRHSVPFFTLVALSGSISRRIVARDSEGRGWYHPPAGRQLIPSPYWQGILKSLDSILMISSWEFPVLKKIKGHTRYERYDHLVGFMSLESQRFWWGTQFKSSENMHDRKTEKYTSGSYFKYSRD